MKSLLLNMLTSQTAESRTIAGVYEQYPGSKSPIPIRNRGQNVFKDKISFRRDLKSKTPGS